MQLHEAKHRLNYGFAYILYDMLPSEKIQHS